MAHGTPDWGVTAGAVTVYQMTDLGELAARLGSINTFDRRGDVILLDDFEDGFHRWTWEGSGSGLGAHLSTFKSRSGRYSLLLTAGSDENHWIYAYRHVFFSPLTALGAEFSFVLPAGFETLTLEMRVNTGTRRLVGYLRWDDPTDALQYRDSAAAYVPLASLPYPSTVTGHLHTWKLVIDTEAEEYVRALLNSQEFPLSGIALWAEDDDSYPLFRFRIRLFGRAGQNDYVFVDDVILTQNEPV